MYYNFCILAVGGDKEGSGISKTLLIVIIVVSILVIAIIIAAVFLYIRYKDQWCNPYDADHTFYTDLVVSSFITFASFRFYLTMKKMMEQFCNIYY